MAQVYLHRESWNGFRDNFRPGGTDHNFSLLAAAMITVYMFRVRTGYLPYTVSLACILGGALGNIIDRLFYAWYSTTRLFFRGGLLILFILIFGMVDYLLLYP